jgi:RHS repeat-associated protein
VSAIADQQLGTFSRTMAYDGLDRLTATSAPGAWGNAAYSYDVLGNLRTSTVGSRASVHSYGANNLLATLQTNGVFIGYAHDPRGNVTGRGTQGFYFDLGNRMVLANGVASYNYDGNGRRVGVSGNNGLTKTNFYDQGGKLLFSSARQGTSLWAYRFIYLGGKLIAETDANGSTVYEHTDALGSPVARTNAAGVGLSRTRYEPYGAISSGFTPGSNGLTDVGFTGHVNDPETGLVYMQQRYYDPLAGRFLSVDPVTTDANTGKSFNRYEYGNNSPYRFIDPDGRASTCSAGMGGCTVYVPSGSGAGTQTGLSGGTSTPGRQAAVNNGAVAGGALGAMVMTACTGMSGGGCALGMPAGIVGGAALGAMVGGFGYDAIAKISSVLSSSANAEGTAAPDLPTGLTGDNPRQGSGNRINTDLPGGAQDVFDRLGGGKATTHNDGTQVAPNGVRLRPEKNGQGPRVDIPANGSRPHETIHFPPGG